MRRRSFRPGTTAVVIVGTIERRELAWTARSCGALINAEKTLRRHQTRRDRRQPLAERIEETREADRLSTLYRYLARRLERGRRLL